jgi:geranylgeranyl diphosphate synthase type I
MQSRLQPAVSSRLSGVVTTVASTTEDYITARLDAETKTWQTVNPALAQPIADLKDMVMRGGKRLRPALCTAAYWGVAQPDATSDQIQQWLRDSETTRDARAQLLGANAALELIQTFALIHDDIMDGALTRRGAPTIHHRWGLLHSELKWRGESRRVSEGVAILVGDLAFVYADIMLRGASASVIDVFNALRLEVNYGQYLDVYATAALMPTMSDAQQIAQYKSGSARRFSTVMTCLASTVIQPRPANPLDTILSKPNQPCSSRVRLRARRHRRRRSSIDSSALQS